MPYNLRQLFATILVYCNPTDLKELWEHFEQDISTDFQTSDATLADIRTKILQSVSSVLDSMGNDINIFYLLDDGVSSYKNEIESREINDEFVVLVPEKDLLASTTLTNEQ